MSAAHHVAAKGYFIALVATNVETGEPEKELEPGLKLLGPILEKFVSVTDQYKPTDMGEQSKVRRDGQFLVNMLRHLSNWAAFYLHTVQL